MGTLREDLQAVLDARKAPVCDFCNSADVTWTYPAADFDAGVDVVDVENGERFGNMMIGAWAACDNCHDAIESGDREALVARCIPAGMEPDPVLVLVLNTLHDGFFENRKTARPLGFG